MKIEKLYPVCKDYLWGGTKLKEKYGKKTELTPCAESWELSFHKDGETRLASGETLASKVTEKEIGTKASAFPFFPVLVKFIDAKADLSVQVHPSDAYALEKENSYGKTETWYIVEAEEGAGIYLGFKRSVSKEEFVKAIEEKRLTDLLNFYEVKAGESYFIPSGTIHAIGKGCLICEIQQNSNLTYRVYDYGRKDKNGNERELHIEKALQVTDLNAFTPVNLPKNTVGDCEYFRAQKYEVNSPLKLRTDGAFHCVSCVHGTGKIDGQPIFCGDSFFVPADFGEYVLDGEMEVILTTL
jgi:mannose-6-phosphate isomerase